MNFNTISMRGFQEIKMCIRVDCKKCGKYSWAGCGKHLTSLYANIEKGKHCMCKDWPGVAIPPPDDQDPPSSSSSSSSTTKGTPCIFVY